MTQSELSGSRGGLQSRTRGGVSGVVAPLTRPRLLPVPSPTLPRSATRLELFDGCPAARLRLHAAQLWTEWPSPGRCVAS